MVNDPLLIRYIEGETNGYEESMIQRWLDADVQNREHFEFLKFVYEGTHENDRQEEMHAGWRKINARIRVADIRKSVQLRTKLRWIASSAAVIVIAIGTSLVFNLTGNTTTIRGTAEKPLASILPDGSEVFLTKGSRLIYNQDFNNEHREVSLSGEAFFKVGANRELPFIVHTGDANVKVTGTSFLVSAPQKTDNIEVVVESGKVLFYNSETFSENSFKVGLGPGERGIYSISLNQIDKTLDNQYKNLNWN